MKLVLFNYWRSSASYRVRIALHAKKLPFEYVAVNLLKGEQGAAPHRARNPSGYVPALSVDGKIVFESVAILELLEELAPEIPLYPKDPFERARARGIVEIINSGIQPLHNLNVLHRVSPDEGARAEWSRHFIAKGLGALEAVLTAVETAGVKGKFALGDQFTVADVCLAPQLYGAKRFSIDLTPFPRVARAGEAALATEAVQAGLPEKQVDAPPA